LAVPSALGLAGSLVRFDYDDDYDNDNDQY